MAISEYGLFSIAIAFAYHAAVGDKPDQSIKTSFPRCSDLVSSQTRSSLLFTG